MDIGLGDLHRRHDLGVDPAHDVSLEETGLLLLLPPLVVEPTVVNAGGEAAGIGGEVGFHGLEGQGAQFDQGLQDRRESWVLPCTGRLC